MKRTKYKFNCKKCGTEYFLFLSEKEYNSGNYRKYCSRSCANSRNTKGKTKQVICNKCGKEFITSIHTPLNTCLCESCRKENKLLKKDNKCKITGYLLNKCNDCYFYKEHICTKRICSITQKINNLVKAVNFDESVIGTSKIIDEFINKKNEVEDLYLNQKLSESEISSYYNQNRTFNIIYNVFNIKSRNLSEAVLNAVENGKIGGIEFNTKYKDEHHITWDNKEVYLRSSYESDYANELDSKKIKYEVEKLRILYFNTVLNKNRIAIPDFYLPESNTIVEIKSNYTLDIQEMKDKFKEYKNLGYNTKLILEHKEVDINLL